MVVQASNVRHRCRDGTVNGIAVRLRAAVRRGMYCLGQLCDE